MLSHSLDTCSGDDFSVKDAITGQVVFKVDGHALTLSGRKGEYSVESAAGGGKRGLDGYGMLEVQKERLCPVPLGRKVGQNHRSRLLEKVCVEPDVHVGSKGLVRDALVTPRLGGDGGPAQAARARDCFLRGDVSSPVVRGGT